MTSRPGIMPKLFISYSSVDRPWATNVRDLLIEEGYRVFLDDHRDDGIVAGAEWQPELSRQIRLCSGIVLLCSKAWLKSPWCVSEAILAEEWGKPLFPITSADLAKTVGMADTEPPQLPTFVERAQRIDLGRFDSDEAHGRLLAGLATRLGTDFGVPPRPYPGLKAFSEDDAAIFCGRDRETDAVLALLERCRRGRAEQFVLVLGASGSGKSSLARAGVIPRLRRVDQGERSAWVVTSAIFGREGLEGLRQSLAQAASEAGFGEVDIRDLLTDLERATDVDAVLSVTRTILRRADRPDGHVLLFLDQLEEVFRTPPDSDNRRLLRLALECAATDSSRLVVLATMRSEYLNEFQSFEGAGEHYEEVTLDPMPRSRFSEVIALPAHKCGVELEGGLTERLVNDAQFDDALPMLAFTLEQLHLKGGDDHLLTLEEYERFFPPVSIVDATGSETVVAGVSAAIKLRADEVLQDEGYDPLDAQEHNGGARMRDLRAALLRLVELGPDGQLLRRTAPRRLMPESAEAVLQRLVDEHLLVSGWDGGEPTLAVAHEALFRVWHTFRIWLERSWNALVLRSQVRRAATDWDRRERRGSLRWPEDRVVDVVTILDEAGVTSSDPFDGIERDFLGALNEDAIVASLQQGSLTLLERAGLGRRLALFGDGRPGVGLDRAGLPDLQWCRVPAGTVRLRTYTESEQQGLRAALSRLTGGSVPDPAARRMTDRRLSASDLERELEDFSVSTYPVTRAQFSAFLTSGDFDDSSWWHGLERPAARPKPQVGFPNHPAIRLTWFAAVAFCRWLSARLDREIRLPTEYEWQQAASGGDDRLYPWGGATDDIASRANTFDSRVTADSDLLPTTTAVGLFPAGVSPSGAMDMSGNVWEWCDSFFHGDRRGVSADRVVRGGSWVIGSGICTSIYAGSLVPSADRFFVGFRPITTTS